MLILYQKSQKAFTTLFIVLLLGSISLAFVLYISTVSFWTMRNSIDVKQATQARYVVDSCGEQILEIIRNNNNFTGTNQNLSFEGYICRYSVTNLGTGIRLITADVSYKNFTKKIEIKTSSLKPITLEYWIEK